MKKLVLLLAVIASVSFFSCNKGAGSASAADSDSVAAPATATDSAAVKA